MVKCEPYLNGTEELYLSVCMCFHRSEEGIRSLGDGVIGSCEQSSVCAGI